MTLYQTGDPFIESPDPFHPQLIATTCAGVVIDADDNNTVEADEIK
jgi:hypothetical protein